jgi:surface antigen
MYMMLRAIFAAALLSAVQAPAPAEAQANASAPQAGERCRDGESRRRRSSVLGGLGRSVLNRVGAPSNVAGIAIPTEMVLSEAISALLDCRERQQAAAATNEAIRGGAGTTTTWQSESRPNVSGSARADAEERSADGTHCLTVTNIVIVNGEETRAPQRMCRAPGARGYARV